LLKVETSYLAHILIITLASHTFVVIKSCNLIYFIFLRWNLFRIPLGFSASYTEFDICFILWIEKMGGKQENTFDMLVSLLLTAHSIRLP